MKGRLHYLTWDRPWCLIENDGQLVDIAPVFWDFAEANRGAPASLNISLDRIDLVIDPSEPLRIDFDGRGAGIILRSDARFQNITAYLAMAMERFNGRQVDVDLSSTSFALVADPAEAVPEVLFKIEGGNEGRIPEGEERNRCKIGQGSECCIFVLFNSSGFECGKFGTFSRVLLERHVSSKMAAGRIGNCRLGGREKANG